MFLALGVGAFAAGIFHLMTHAFFKALLFLGAGSVIHAMSGEQDIRKMGGLWDKIPNTAKRLGSPTLAIAGIFPFAGFFSKDEISGAPLIAIVLYGSSVSSPRLRLYMARFFFDIFGYCRATSTREHIQRITSAMIVRS